MWDSPGKNTGVGEHFICKYFLLLFFGLHISLRSMLGFLYFLGLAFLFSLYLNFNFSALFMLLFERTCLDSFHIWGSYGVALLIDLSLTIELPFFFFPFCGLSLYGFVCTDNCVEEVRYQGK